MGRGLVYVKLDGCYLNLSRMDAAYELMGKSRILQSVQWFTLARPFYIWNGGLEMNYTLLMSSVQFVALLRHK